MKTLLTMDKASTKLSQTLGTLIPGESWSFWRTCFKWMSSNRGKIMEEDPLPEKKKKKPKPKTK
jgi:hypothetical protein